MKIEKRTFLVVLLSAVVFVGLAVYVGYTSESLAAEASEEGRGEGVIYDSEGVVTYYIDSVDIEGTLIYTHYHNSAGVRVTCFSCHEEDVLRRLYLLCEEDANYNREMQKSLETCLVCHSSFERLAELTADYADFVDSAGNSANPHIYGGGIAPGHTAAPCLRCHDSMHSVATYDPVNYCYGCHHTGLFQSCSTCH